MKHFMIKYQFANGTTEEMRTSTHPRVRQFFDRIAEPEVTNEMDYLQMLTGDSSRAPI